jgi:hypothetical protein
VERIKFLQIALRINLYASLESTVAIGKIEHLATGNCPPGTHLRRLVEGVKKIQWITTKNPLD